MTSAEQPAPYPGDVGLPVNDSGRPPVHREYKDAFGRALVGVIVIRDEATDASITRPLVGGVLDAPLQPGSYRLIASLTTVDGDPWYQVETLTVGAYW